MAQCQKQEGRETQKKVSRSLGCLVPSFGGASFFFCSDSHAPSTWKTTKHFPPDSLFARSWLWGSSALQHPSLQKRSDATRPAEALQTQSLPCVSPPPCGCASLQPTPFLTPVQLPSFSATSATISAPGITVLQRARIPRASPSPSSWVPPCSSSRAGRDRPRVEIKTPVGQPIGLFGLVPWNPLQNQLCVLCLPLSR